MRKHISLFLFVLCLQLEAQEASQSNFFYYYKGKPISLAVDSAQFMVVSEGKLDQISLDLNEITIVKSYQCKNYNVDSRVLKSNEAKDVYFTTVQYNKATTQLKKSKLINTLITKDNIIQVLPSFKKRGKSFDVTNRFYVKMKSLEDTLLLKRLAVKYSLDIIGPNKYMPLWYTMACVKGSGHNAIDAANLFYELGLFAATEPEFVNAFHLLSNDPYYNEQWGLKNTGQDGGLSGMDINIEGAWNITKGNDSILVTVFDTGVDKNHEDLKECVVGYFDAFYGDSILAFYGEHGTICAGVIAASHNDIGIKGISPNTKILSVGHNFIIGPDYTQDYADGFNWAWKVGKTDVINCSWFSLVQSDMLTNAIDSALTRGRRGNGCVVTFASGNFDLNMVDYPGDSHPDILVVGGILNNGKRCNPDDTDWGSNYGIGLDVMAPGENIKTTLSDTIYRKYSGTSLACPHVSGLAALILSVNPKLTNVEVNTIIESTSRKVRPDIYTYSITADKPNGTWNNKMGYGLIDATAAVKAARTYKCDEIHISNLVMNKDDTLYYRNVVMDNIQIKDSASVTIKKFQKITLNSNIQVDKGASFKIIDI